MSDTVDRSAPRRGRFRRALQTFARFIQELDYTAVDYSLDRFEKLERELAELKEEVRQLRTSGTEEP